jgi:PAS domain S-box-containing protein
MHDWQSLVSTAEERDFISAVLDTAGALVVVLDHQGRIVRFNRACERTTGYAFEEVRGRPLWDLFLIPEEVESVRAVFDELRAGQFPNEHENYWMTRDGRRLISWSNTALLGADGAVEHVIGTGIDVTERRQAEAQRDATLEALRRARDDLEQRIAERTVQLEKANQILEEEVIERRSAEQALRETEGHLRSLMASAQSYAVYRVAVDPTNPFLARVVLASPSMQELLSISDLEDFSSWFDNIHPDDLARIVEANRRSLETGVPFEQQFRAFRAGPGEWAAVHVRSTPVFDVGGRLTHFNGLVVDVTEHRRAEAALRESEEKFRGIVELANVGIAIVLDARFRFVNQHWASMLGYTVEELLGTEFMPYCTPEERDRIVGFYARRVRGEPAPTRYETVMLHKDGTRVYAEVSVGMIPYEGRQATFVFLRDITEEKRARQALEEAYQTLEQRVEERTRELSTLLDVSKKLASTLELEPLLGSILDELKSVVHCEGCTIYGLEYGELVARAYRGPMPQETAMSLRWRADNPLDRLAIRGRKPVLVSDTHGDSPEAQAYRESMGELQETLFPHIGCWLGVPLIVRDDVIGVLTLHHNRPNFLTRAHASFAMAFANQAAVAIENARLYEAEQNRREESEGRRRVAEGMREILAVLNSRQSLPEILDFIATQTCRLLGSQAAAILRLKDGHLRIQAACGLEDDYVVGMILRPGEGGGGRALAERQPVIISELAEAAFLAPEQEIPPEPQKSLIERLLREYRSILSVPLIVQGRDYGAITIYYSAPQEFSEEDLSLAMSVSDQVALAIENARLQEQAGQAAAMEERGRLARELHDSVTQSLYSVTMYTEAAARLMTARQAAEAAEYLRDARDTAQEALREMRLMIYQLRPPVLEKGGLAVALQVRLDAVERRGGIHAELIVEGEDRLPPAIQAELHQIAQEALNNALKHAHAREVGVRLHFGDAATCLAVQDDGVGFELAAAQAGGGMGLPGMVERAQKVGARLEIETVPGLGTKVLVEVPTGGGG